MAPFCKVCRHEFHLEKRTPVSLSCGHSFCRQCLCGIQKRTSTFKCPTCFRTHLGPPVTDLATNLDFLDLSSPDHEKAPEIPTPAANMAKGSILFLIKSSEMQIPIKLQLNTKLADLKLLLQIQYGLDAHSGFISFQGERLEDERTLLECNITSGAVLHVDGIEYNEEVINHLGKGGFGDVYLIKRNGRCLVMKKVNLVELNEKARSLAIQEMKLLEDLNHPNIVSYVGGYKKTECLHIFMEYCSGGDLARQIELKKQEGGFFSEDQVSSWTHKITEAIAYIHDRKIIHRDIKPANIFLSDSGIIKIGDFGISRVLGDNTSRGSTMIGTAKYTAIEVMNNEGFTTKADMFSLGCTVYEIAALKTNYPYVKVLLPECFSDGFKNLVVELLAHDPDKRPDAQDVLRSSILKRMQGVQSSPKHRILQEEESNFHRLQQNSQSEKTVANLRRCIEEQVVTPSPAPKALPRKKKAPPIPPRPESLGPALESCLEVLDKFCFDYESGMNPDQQRGLEDIIMAMQAHRNSRLIQIRGCLSLSYITMQTERRILNPATRGQIVSVLTRALQNYPNDWNLRIVCCQTLCQFAKPLNLLLRTRQLVPQLLKLIRENEEKRDSWSCLYALHLIHILSSRVGEEFRIIIAQFGAMEVLSKIVKDGRREKYYEDVYKSCWSIICNLTDETPINCERFVSHQGLSLIIECLSAFPDSYHKERSLWITLSNISEVKRLRHHLLRPELLNILLNYLDPKSHGNEISWKAAKILVHLLCDGEKAWSGDLQRSLVVHKIEEAMSKWDLDSEPQSSFQTLRPLWLLFNTAHTPVCQYWAIWTLAKLTRVHRDRYCPMIVEEGGLRYLQQLVNSITKSPRKSTPFKRTFSSSPNPSFSTLLLTMQVKNTCEDYTAYGAKNRDLLMKLFNAASDGELEIVEELIKTGINLNSLSTMTGHDGRSAIHLATLNGNTEILCALLDAGAFVDTVDFEGMTALHTAALKGRLDILNLLLIYGSDLDAVARMKSWKAVHFAAVGGHVHLLEFLSERCDLGELTKDQRTALHLAAENGKESVVRWLIAKGLNIRYLDANGHTPLDYATQKNHGNIVAIFNKAQKS